MSALTVEEKLERHNAKLRDLRDDPVGFCRYVLDFDPHEGQARWLNHSSKPENALTTGNRWGKSFIAAAGLIHRCTYRKGWTRAIRDAMVRKHEAYQALNCALSADQSRLVWHKAHAMLQAPRAQILVKSVKLTPFPAIEFINGAILQARSTAREGVYLLGHDYDVVNWDEAAYEKKYERIRDNVIRMRLVDRGGTLLHTSTGNGRNAYGRYFLEGLEGKDPNLYAQSGSTVENPHIDQSRVALNAQRMPDAMRRQNIEGAIIDGGGDYFPLEDIAAAHDDSLDDLIHVERDDDQDQERHAWLRFVENGGSEKPWHVKYPNHRYIHGWDPADKKDWCVGTTWDVSTSPATLVEFERFHKKGWDYNYQRIRARHHKYGTSKATKVDCTGLGDVVLSDLQDIGAEGISFSGGHKDELLTNLQTLLSLRLLRWPMIMVLHDEFTFYERDDEGLDTDCVMSVAVAGWWIKRKNVTLLPAFV